MKRLIFSLLIITSILSCGKSSSPNIILVSIDGLRPDYLTPWGGEEATAPELTALISESVVFEHCYTETPLTLPAHATLFTSLLPKSHGIYADRAWFLNSEQETLAEILRKKGYETLGVVANSFLARETGLGRGFDTYEDQLLKRPNGDNPLLTTDLPFQAETRLVRRPAAAVSEFFEEMIPSEVTNPIFLFAHFGDLVQPYRPPESTGSEPYTCRLSRVSEAVGTLVSLLKSKDLYDNSIIVIVSAHGEAMGGEEGYGHGYTLSDAVTHVPLLIKLTAQAEGGGTVKDWVSLADIAPTILEYAGLDDPEFSSRMEGVSIVDGRNEEHPPVLSQTFLALEQGVGGLSSLLLSEPYRLWVSRYESYVTGPDGRIEDKDLAQSLRSLYSDLFKKYPPSFAPLPDSANEKTKKSDDGERIHPVVDALDLLWNGDDNQAIAVLAQTIREKEAGLSDYLLLADLLQRRGDYKAAKETLRQANALSTSSVPLLLALVENGMLSGDTSILESTLDKISDLRGELPFSVRYRTALMLTRGDAEQANNFLEESRNRFGDISSLILAEADLLAAQSEESKIVIRGFKSLSEQTEIAWLSSFLRGKAALMEGNRERAQELFKLSIQQGATEPEAYLQAGIFLKDFSQLDSAAPLLRAALWLSKESPRYMYEWGDLKARQGEWGEAYNYFGRVLLLQPANPGAQLSFMKVAWMLGRKQESLTFYGGIMKARPDMLISLIQRDEVIREIHTAFMDKDQS